MAATLPKIKVTDAAHPGSSPGAQEGALAATAEAPLRNRAAIDPLSQQILQRTNTSPAAHKLRPQNADPVPSPTPASPSAAHADKKQSGEVSRDGGAHATDKKKVSFLSRFIGGSKKKAAPETASDNGTEADDPRPEGMDAQLYVDNLSFSPKIPQPPAYIKVRTRFKKNKEFDRVFLAQELRAGSDKKSAPAAGSNPAPQSGSAATQNPIWAVEFSRDGRFLAAGGQDRAVRVWAVITGPEDRLSHERSDGETRGNLSAPVFQQKLFREYHGHTATILDLSWSKNNFLLSSSMDKTVRLWHISRDENLCVFKHSDFVPSIQFHPTDDRFFLAGSLDAKLRLWSIPDKNVAFSVTVPDMITAVAFTPEGKTCIAGTLGGLCTFYDTEKLKWQAQMHVKSTRGQNAKGSKITGIQATYWPPGSDSGEIKLLITSNDSRLRLYNFKDKSLEMKFMGHENNCSQIRGAFADSSGHVICGSEDRKAYIWSTTTPDGDKRNQRPVEMFEAHSSITTCTIIAPIQTRQLLSASEDPIFDLCNPPPVTLVSKAESVISSRAPTEAGSARPTPAPTESALKKAAETPAYLARCAHRGGNIIVTADFTGALKVFRQDCAFTKRLRMTETWDAASVRRAGSRLGRPSSILSRTSHSRRSSTSTQPPNDRIMTWRQGISHGSLDSNGSLPRRSASPRKSLARLSLSSVRNPDSPRLRPIPTDESSISGQASVPMDHTPSQSATQSETSTPPRMLAQDRTPPLSTQNPLAVYNGQSWLFWTANREKKAIMGQNENERPTLDSRVSALSQISKLTSEVALSEHETCTHCGSDEFKVTTTSASAEKAMACAGCGGAIFDNRNKGHVGPGLGISDEDRSLYSRF